MASTAAVSMAMPLAYASPKKALPGNDSFKPLPLRSSRAASSPSNSPNRFQVRASMKEKAVAGLTVAALTASMVIPDIALASSDLSPSLKNFLLSIVSGGVVLAAIVGAVIEVSNFRQANLSI